MIAAGSNAKHRARVVFKVQVWYGVGGGANYFICVNKTKQKWQQPLCHFSNWRNAIFMCFGFSIAMRKCFSTCTLYVHMCVCGTKENVLINLKFLNAIWVSALCACVPSFRKSVYSLFGCTLGNKMLYVCWKYPEGLWLGHVTITVAYIQTHTRSVKKTESDS